MMTRVSRRLKAFSSLLASLFVLTACTIAPNGVSSDPNFVPLTDSVGIIISDDHIQKPQFTFGEHFSVPMIVDERIVGSWSFTQGMVNVALLSDGTATTTTPSYNTRSGRWLWMAGNIIGILYTNGQFEIMRFDNVEQELWMVTIYSEYDVVPASFLAVKVDNQFEDNINVHYQKDSVGPSYPFWRVVRR